MVRPSAAAFFQRGPAFLPPGGDGGLVALGRPLDRALHAMTDRVQQPADVGWVVRDAKRAPDHVGHPPAGPDLATKAVGFRSLCEELRQLGDLLGGEPRLATWSGMAPQALDALLPGPFEPLADGARRHPERGGDVLLLPALFFQLPSASPPPFAPVEPGFLCAHGASVALL